MTDYLNTRLAEDFNAPQWQAVLICAALSLFYFVWKGSRYREMPLPHIPEDSERIFEEVFNNFPFVRKCGQEYLIRAFYYPPYRHPRDFPRHPLIAFAWLTALAGFVFLFSVMAAAVIMTVALTTSHRWKATSPFCMEIWMNAERIRWYSIKNTEPQTAPTDGFKLRVRIPHRLASHEAHENDNIVRASRGPIPPSTSNAYQSASELLILSGPGDSVVREVIDIGNDERGEKANALLHAIDFIREHCLKEARTAAEGRKAGPADTAEAATAHAAAPVEPFE